MISRRFSKLFLFCALILVLFQVSALGAPCVSDQTECNMYASFMDGNGFAEKKEKIPIDELCRVAAKASYDSYCLTDCKKTTFGNVDGIPAGTIELTKIDGKDVVLIAFHGTANANDGLVDLNAVKVACPIFGGRSVHRGFWTRYISVRADLMAKLMNFYASCGSDISLVVTGHSLGGALATLCGLDLEQLLPNKVRVVTYCAPRVLGFDAWEFAIKLIPEKSGRFIRFWRECDVVPSVGMGWMGFKHFGGSYCLRLAPSWSSRMTSNWILGYHSMNEMLKDITALSVGSIKFEDVVLKNSVGIVRERYRRDIRDYLLSWWN